MVVRRGRKKCLVIDESCGWSLRCGLVRTGQKKRKCCRNVCGVACEVDGGTLLCQPGNVTAGDSEVGGWSWGSGLVR